MQDFIWSLYSKMDYKYLFVYDILEVAIQYILENLCIRVSLHNFDVFKTLHHISKILIQI